MSKEIGDYGEDMAVRFLKEKGLTLMEQNWRFKRAEVDIILKDEKRNILVFAEVKTRKSDAFGNPESFITEHKKRMLADAATVYASQINHEWEVRFDVVSIVLTVPVRLEHFEDAFFPCAF